MPGPSAWDASAYERVAQVQLGWGKKVLERRRWRGDEVVLDAGCGPGTLTEHVLSKVPRGRVIAVDNDPSMVARARERLGPFASRVRVVEADVANLGDVEPVDVIFSNAVLHWVPDHDQAFESFVKHLKPGGELLLQCGGEGNLEAARSIADVVMAAPDFRSDFRGWKAPWRYEDDASTTERLFIAGFIHAEVSLEPAPVTFATDPEFEAFLRTVVLRPYLAWLPSQAHQDLFVRTYLEQAKSTRMGRNLDYVRLNVRAQRPPHVS